MKIWHYDIIPIRVLLAKVRQANLLLPKSVNILSSLECYVQSFLL